MTWSRAQFEITDTEAGTKVVSGWTSPAGLGLHVEDDHTDEVGRRRWNITHLRSGMMFMRALAYTPEEATELGDLIIDEAKWSDYATLSDLMKADPGWVPRLIGIKHVLAGDGLEFPDPAMNDAANVIMLPREQLEDLERRALISATGEWIGKIRED